MNKRCEGVHSALVHADRREEGARVIENNLKLAPAVVAHAATAAG